MNKGSASDPPAGRFANPFRKANPNRKESPNKLNNSSSKKNSSLLYTSFNPFNVTTSSTNPFSPASSWADNDEETAADVSNYSGDGSDYVLADNIGGGSLSSKDELSCATPSPLRYSALNDKSGYRNHNHRTPTKTNKRNSSSRGAAASRRGDSHNSSGGSMFGDLLSTSFDGYSNKNKKDNRRSRSDANSNNHRVNDQFMLVKVADLLKKDQGDGGSGKTGGAGQRKTVNENVESGGGSASHNNNRGGKNKQTSSGSMFCGGGYDGDDEPIKLAPTPPPSPPAKPSQESTDGPCSTLFFLWLYMTATIYGGMMVLSVVSFLLAFPYTGSFSSERERDFFQLAMLGFAAMFGWVLMSMWISYKEKQYGWAFVASLPSLLIFGAIVVVLQTGSIGPGPTPSPTSYDPYYYRYQNNRNGGGASGDQGGYYYNGRWYNDRGEVESGDYNYGGQGYYGQQQQQGANQQQNYYNNNYGG